MVEPFKGLRVVELGSTQASAQASQLFADFGAEVIMVEPRGGSPLRAEAAFPFWARGKKSVVLDLESGDDVARLQDLLRGADLLIETCPAGLLERIGLGHEALARENPGLIHGTITGFGADSPYAALPLDEQVVQACTGIFRTFARMTPTPERPPYVSVPFATHSAVQALLHGMLAALHERTRSGLGQHVETNFLLAFLTLDSWMWYEYAITKRFPDAMAPAPSFDAQGRPCHHLMMRLLVAPTADGHWLQFAATAPRLFKAKLNALGLGWMFTDPEWSAVPMFDSPDKFMNLWTRMIEATRAKTLAEWQAIFDTDPDVFAEQFRTAADVLDHPQLVHDGLSIVQDDPQFGPVKQPGALIRAMSTPARPGTAPALDADRLQLLTKGWSLPALPRPAPSTPAPRGLPLEGVTIVELCSMFAAPGGPALLTELGARVIKIEPPAGDPIRNIASLPEVAGIRPMLGKESICIDLTKPEGRDLVRDLCRDADVVVQSYRAGAIERLGLDYEAIRAINPDVIYLNASGYGIDGPFGRRPAYAPSIGAAGGFSMTNLGIAELGDADMPLAKVQDLSRRLGGAGTTDMAQADGVACNVVATAILFGLVARDLGAGGQDLRTSMLNSASHSVSGFSVRWPGSPTPAMVDPGLWGTGALHRIYQAAQGYVFLSASREGAWERLVAVLGDGALATDARFATAAARQANDGELIAALEQAFAGRPAAQWQAEGLRQGLGLVQVCDRPIQANLFDTEMGEQHHLMVDIVHPTWGELPRQAPHVTLSRSAVQTPTAVMAGEQTDLVLTKAGKADEIPHLRETGVVC